MRTLGNFISYYYPFVDFFRLQVQYNIHVFSRDTEPHSRTILYMFLVRFRATILNVEAPFFVRKVEGFRTKLPVTYKENSFPNVNFKLDKASLSANRKDFHRRRD